MKRIGLFITVLIISVWSLCAESWFVCAGSFSKYDNAKDRCVLLSSEGYDCFVGTVVKADGTKLFRVLFLDDVMIRDDARAKKEKLSKIDTIVKMGLKDLWICQAEMPAKNAENVFHAKVKADKILVEKSVVPAPVYVPELLNVPEIPSVIESPSVVMSDIAGISESVISCISQFPENPLYVVEDFSIVDYTNYENNPFNALYGTDDFFAEMQSYEELSAGAYLKMVNAMTDKEIEMIVLKAEEGLSEEFISEEVIYYWDEEDIIRETGFKVNYGKMISVISGDDKGLFVCGVSEDSKMVIYISAEDYSEAEIMDFLTTSFGSSGSENYKELLKSLLPADSGAEK